MVLLFRDASDKTLGILSVDFAGYDPTECVFWVTSDSGVEVSFPGVVITLADTYLRTLARGFLDLSVTPFMGEVDYGE